jgi:AraC-like DNA-binding protein
MKQIFTAAVLSFLLMSFKADITGPWVINCGDKIELHTRPIHYSNAASPDSLAILQILKEQNQAIDHINQVLHSSFSSRVQIFLFNKDEAKTKIGTNQGGLADRNKNRICFTYFERPKDMAPGDTFSYLGIHEMVHVITNKELGFPGSLLFGEGFANAIDGTYGNAPLSVWMKEYVMNDQIIKPVDLLEKTNIPARIFYPQSGFFIRWLFNQYGMDKAKKLFKINKKHFAEKFKKITGESFETMTGKYLKYCNEYR